MNLRNLIARRRYTISSLDRLICKDGKGTKFFDISYAKDWAPFAGPEGQSSAELQSGSSASEVTTLKNGIRVVSQRLSTPGQVHLGLLLGVGSRDESAKSSGSLHSIKTTKYKSAIQTNETVNYGMVQMSGGSYDMTFDRENSFFKASCLAHDTVDLFKMISDCALEPRNLLAASVGQYKMPFSHNFLRSNNSNHDFCDLVMRNTYGDSGLGNKVLGEISNIDYLDAFSIQKFQIENISTEKIVVSGLGVEDHMEFVGLVEQVLGELDYSSSVVDNRGDSKFRENHILVPEKNNNTQVAICFEGASWNSENFLSSQVLESLLGGVEANHFDSVTKPVGELAGDFYASSSAVNAVEAFSMHYSDTGVFGLRLNASAQSAPELSRNLIKTVSGLLKGLTTEQFEGAKKRLRVRIRRALDDPQTRLEELARNVSSFNRDVSEELLSQLTQLDSVTFAKQARQILNGKVNFTAQGGNVDDMPSIQEIRKLLG